MFSSYSFQDHIQEVLDKWESIDDEIWAKVIVLERNRRVAKAYARAPRPHRQRQSRRIRRFQVRFKKN